MREIKTSVTNFIHHQGKYLFIHRTADRKVDANLLNGIGGKVEPGEDFLSAAIRETEEETGYVVTKQDVIFAGMGRTEAGYPEDWVMGFFKIEVPSFKIPIGSSCREGEFLWLTIDEALEQTIELVDDLHYLLKMVDENKLPFFINAQFNDQEKIEKMSLTHL